MTRDIRLREEVRGQFECNRRRTTGAAVGDHPTPGRPRQNGRGGRGAGRVDRHLEAAGENERSGSSRRFVPLTSSGLGEAKCWSTARRKPF